MLNEEEMKVIEKGMITMWIIWAVIFVSLFIYIFIAHNLGQGIRQEPAQDFNLPLMRNILMIIGIFEIFIIHIFRRFMLPKGPDSYAVEVKDKSSVSDPAEALTQYTKTTIITLALAESIGIYGLVLFFLGDSFQVLYLFMAVSAAVMFYYRPKRDELKKILAKWALPHQDQ